MNEYTLHVETLLRNLDIEFDSDSRKRVLDLIPSLSLTFEIFSRFSRRRRNKKRKKLNQLGGGKRSSLYK